MNMIKNLIRRWQAGTLLLFGKKSAALRAAASLKITDGWVDDSKTIGWKCQIGKNKYGNYVFLTQKHKEKHIREILAINATDSIAYLYGISSKSRWYNNILQVTKKHANQCFN